MACSSQAAGEKDSTETLLSGEEILEQIGKLNDDDYKALLYAAFDDQDRPVTLKKTMAKHFSKRLPYLMEEAKAKGVPAKGKIAGCPEASTPVSGRVKGTAAFKVPLIYRSDLIPTKDFIYFDVEKLSLKKSPTDAKHEMKASTVAAVNHKRDVLLWAFIKWTNICQTFPNITGILKEKLEIGFTLEYVQPLIKAAFKGNTLVGWDLDKDLLSLGLTPSDYVREDLSDYFEDPRGQKYSLKDTWNYLYLGKEKSFQCGIHGAIQDARATRDVHVKMLELKRIHPNASKVPFPIPRGPKEPFKPDRRDVCRCNRNDRQF